MGLTGMIIVDDGTDVRLGLPRTFGIDDLPLILQKIAQSLLMDRLNMGPTASPLCMEREVTLLS
jgi:hypothetical protein